MHGNRRNFIKLLTVSGTGALINPLDNRFSDFEKFEEILLENEKSDKNDPEAFWMKVSKQFKFEKGLHYFNNGSLGACPKTIRKATESFRNILDDFPSKYMWGGWENEKEETRKKVADLFNVSNEEIALIHNTTEGMNLIARSLDLKEGDEVILANHEHSSGRICWEVFQETRGVKMVRPDLPLLPQKKEEIVEVYKNAITERTKVISMCHIVNTNGMMLPVKEVSEIAKKKGILVAVDGAQSAGMIRINLHELGCDFYTASAHKWLFAPKGTGIFYAKESSQQFLKPLIVCRGYRDQSIRRLENYNTRNLPEVLGLGAAIDYHNSIGSNKIHERTFELKDYFRKAIQKFDYFKLKSPYSNELSAGIQVVELIGKDVGQVKGKLFDSYGIDCRPMRNFELNAVRISLSIFNTKKEIDYLVGALVKIAEA